VIAGETRLVAYLVARAGHSLPDAAELRAALAVMREAVKLNRQLDESREQERRLAGVDSLSVRALVDLYLQTKRFRDLSDSRQYRNRRQVEAIATWAERRGCTDITKITKADIEAHLELLEDKPSDQLDARSAWNILCTEAIGLRWRLDNPAKLIPWTAPKPAPVTLWKLKDVEAYAAMAVQMRQPGLAALIETQFECGQRLGDLRNALHGEHYNGECLIMRQSKTDEIVNIPLTISLRRVIEDARVPGSDYLFNDFDHGKPFTDSRLFERFEEVRVAVTNRGSPYLLLQKLRHSAVCDMISAGATLAEVASVTGHTFATVHQIMKRYALDRDRFADSAVMKRNRARGGSDADFSRSAPIENRDWLAREQARRGRGGPQFDMERPGRFLPALLGQHRHGWRLPDELLAWGEELLQESEDLELA
jgi:site-specific recombinase XerC